MRRRFRCRIVGPSSRTFALCKSLNHNASKRQLLRVDRQRRHLRREPEDTSNEYVIQCSAAGPLPTTRVHRGWRIAGPDAGDVVSYSSGLFPCLPDRLVVLDRYRWGIAGAADVAAPDRRRLGTGNSSRTRSGNAHAAVHGGAIYSDHSRFAFALRVDSSGTSQAASGSGIQGGLSKRAFLHRACSYLFRSVDHVGVLSESLVALAGPHG